MKVNICVSLVALSLLSWTGPSAARSPALGAYVGNDPAELARFERWLGRDVDLIAAHTGRANWRDWVNSIKWSVNLWTPLNKPIAWTIPLFADGGTLHDAAMGAYREYYLQAARILNNTRPSDEAMYVRIGEEFNGTWMPWAAAGREKEFVRAYRQFVDSFRSISTRFRFEWNVNIRETGMDPADAYPGDDYVDIVGMDFYYNTRWNPADPGVAWSEMVSGPFGLRWLEQFAAAHNKPTAYPEWGVNSDGAGAYIKNAAEWFASHNVVYQRIWDADGDFRGKLSDGQYPNAAAAYIASFGRNQKAQ
jgi:beta-mannanase